MRSRYKVSKTVFTAEQINKLENNELWSWKYFEHKRNKMLEKFIEYMKTHDTMPNRRSKFEDEKELGFWILRIRKHKKDV